MATGPEHYQKAERLIRDADRQDPEQAAYTIAKAQVHATLAQAAATALMTVDDHASVAEYKIWKSAAGVAER
jgi:hypothetical protein